MKLLLLIVAAALLAGASPAPDFAWGDPRDDSVLTEGEPLLPSAEAAPRSLSTPPAVGTRAACPVTGVELTVDEETTRSKYEGRHYVFCCGGCKTKVDADPAKYADKRG